jgi:cell division protein FtsW
VSQIAIERRHVGRPAAGAGRKGRSFEQRRPSAAARAPGAARPASRSQVVAGPLEHRLLVACVASLCLLGLPLVLSASFVDAIEVGGSPYSLFERQALFLGIGLVVAVAASRISMEQLRRLRFVLLGGGLVLLLAVFVPGIGHGAGGSSRWIGAGPVQVQPSELMKLAVVVFAADLLARRARRADPWRAVVVPLLILVAFAGILIMKQPDLGTCMVIVCTTFAMLFAAGVPARLVAAGFSLVAVPGTLLALDAAYRRARLLSFLDPFSHASSTGYQVVQSLVTLGQGGLHGSGIGASPATWGYLPNGYTDFIFGVLGGNLGVFGTIPVIALFAALTWAGMRVAYREKDLFTRYVAVGITCWIAVQAVINIGGVIDALPVTGIPLPFISYGGSALIVSLAGAGLLAGIARRQAPAPAPIVRPAVSGSR